MSDLSRSGGSPALEVRALRKSFGTLVAVDDASFSVPYGTIVGLLGPNGAGKTTIVSIISGLLAPDAGEVRIGGRALSGDADPLKRSLGLVPQELALHEELSSEDNLRFFGALYGLAGQQLAARLEAVLKLTGLLERRKEPVDTFSGGMKRRLNLAAGLLHDPQVLLLDEPTAGVDPQSRNAIFESLEALRAEGKTILYTTHYMEEAERLCDRVVIVDRGRVLADDTVAGLSARLPEQSRLVVDVGGDLETLTGALAALPGVAAVKTSGARVTLSVSDLSSAARAVLELLSARGATVTGISSETPRLEEIFLALTGRALRDE